ncbi:MAG: hypothetical protein K2K72_00235 [Duncaniella sp.]|nr:hypothetical protein [Duncaniella sp.]
MNKLIITSLVSLCVVSSASAGGKKLPSMPRKYDYSAVENYFSKYLSGDEAPFTSGYSIKEGQVKEVEAQVWRQWVKANDNNDEEKLPATYPSLYDEMSYEWQLPASLEPDAKMPYFLGYKGETDGKYPFYVYLHGSGPKMQEWVTGVKISQNFDDAPAIYFIPRIPNEGNYYRWWQKSKQWSWNKLLRQVLTRDSVVDPNRIYFFGISEGGYGSQRLASFYADYLAGAGPMAGGEPLINAPAENLRNTAFALHTGEKDYGFLRNELTLITGATLDSLQRLMPDGYVHNVALEPGRGHAITYGVTTPWLKQYTRNPYPKHVNWENFEMDGWYRDGFYNLYVDSRSNPDESVRTYYQMDIDGNNIDVKVDNVTYSVAKEDTRFGFSIGMIFNKTYTPATSGVFTVYLNDQLVDMNRPVTLTVNGKEVFKGKPVNDLRNIVNSCARYFDPYRLYPAAITVDLSTMTAAQ